ncbi:MAG: hypothetical protein NC833_03080 [Candidatus Omnitrophica bacterium]|nr:hypothetical protein [Candidatus Omnitrophota bacterium]
MEKITFKAALYKLIRDYEDEIKITFQIPSSELEKVSKIPAQKVLIIEISQEKK